MARLTSACASAGASLNHNGKSPQIQGLRERMGFMVASKVASHQNMFEVICLFMAPGWAC